MQLSRVPPIHRLTRLSAERRRLLLLALAQLGAASAIVALLPFRRAIAFGSVRLGPFRALDRADMVWAIEAASRYLPLRTKCIEKGLVAQRLLRRWGRDARLHYGARTDTSPGGVSAHVWVSLDGELVIGGEEAEAFAELTSYP